VHVGGEWTLVDSCINPETGEPATLGYLDSIGVSVAESVCLVLVTHWDDDHIGGIHKVVEQCGRASVACSLALNREDVMQFVIEQGNAPSAVGSGLDELRTVLTQCRGTGRLIWAKARLPLHPKASGGVPVVTALSPSDDDVSRSIESLIERATGDPIAVRTRYRAPATPNGASVAASIVANGTGLLLGADLEDSPNALSGWSAVLADARPAMSASVVKVPHHGSKGAHHDEMWAEIVADDAVAIVTPWVVGGGYLPTEEDLDRLRLVAGRVYLTAMPTFKRARKNPGVDKLIAKVAGVRVDELRGWGHVRARRSPDELSWRIDLDGDARLVE
jgi:hypothetical protein